MERKLAGCCDLTLARGFPYKNLSYNNRIALLEIGLNKANAKEQSRERIQCSSSFYSNFDRLKTFRFLLKKTLHFFLYFSSTLLVTNR